MSGLRRIVVLFTVLLLSGCAHLRLEVSVLDPLVVKELADDDRIRKEMPILATQSRTEIEGRFNETKNKHFAAYQEVADSYRKAAAVLPERSAEREQLENAAASFDSFPPALRALYDEKMEEEIANSAVLRPLWESYKSMPGDSRIRRDPKSASDCKVPDSHAELKGAVRAKLIVALDERDSIERTFKESVNRDIAQLKAESVPSSQGVTAPRAVAAVEGNLTLEKAAETHETVNKLFDSGGLPLSPYAYYVASAPDCAWAEKYDRSKARGFFGNTDIAIKSLGQGNYTIKGVSFNPADVAAAASKVATQMVMLAAQIGGVPVSLAGSPSSTAGSPPAGTVLSQSSARIASIAEANKKTQEQVSAHNDALLSIAGAILRERGAIEGSSDANRKAAIEAIKASYESHAPRLTIPATTTTPTAGGATP